VIAQEKAKLQKKGKASDAMDTDSDNSHDMAYVEYDSDSKRKDSEVSPEELAYLAQLNKDEYDDHSMEN
jgi:hypothetical protein